jgi:hypothetical protein
MKASGTRSDLPRAIVDLAQGDDGRVGDGAFTTDVAEAELMLSDLVGDANGEVVIFNDSGFRTVAIRTEATVVAEGEAAKHVTASGEDVSGFKYVTFDNGVTLYFPEGLDLILRSDPPRPTP